MNALISGAAFGAALAASGVFQPAVIRGQLKLESFQMIQVFLTATATSAGLVTVATRLGYLRASPRSFSSVGLFAPCDGNIIGGALLGAGMLLSGACPGTVFAQIGLGVRSGFYALQGAIVAGIVWTGIVHPLIQHRLKAAATPAPEKAEKPKITIYDSLGVSQPAAVLGFQALCATLVAAAYNLTPLGSEARIPPVIAGLLVAGAQLVSILLRSSLIGTSSSFEEVGDWFWGVVARGKGRPERYANAVYCTGMAGGAWLLGRASPTLVQVTEVAISPLAAGLGGFLMLLGSRMAGGCTSGHGISGISLMSTSSFITIGTAFATGGLLGSVLQG